MSIYGFRNVFLGIDKDCAQARFDIELSPRSLVFVYLTTRYLVEDSRYIKLTEIEKY